MLHKKVTRKQFILSALSVFGLLLLNKLPKKITNPLEKKSGGYGTNTYGGI
jgi:hypothetical protein